MIGFRGSQFVALIAALSCAAAAPAASRPPVQLLRSTFATQFTAKVLASHNAARAQAGLPGMAWDNELGKSAAAHARRLALSNRFQHSDRRARNGVGENLWMGTRGAFSIERMVGDWVSERRWFVPGVFPAVTRTRSWADVGHYTQIIWPATTRVGCALASNASADYFVCHYSPAGNIDGRTVGLPMRRGFAGR